MEWISVKDRLPEYDLNGSNRYLTCDNRGFVFGGHQYFTVNREAGFYDLVDGNWEIDKDVTHWMPLPEPPEQPETKLNFNRDISKCPRGEMVLIENAGAKSEDYRHAVAFTDDGVIFWDYYNREKDTEMGYFGNITGWLRIK